MFKIHPVFTVNNGKFNEYSLIHWVGVWSESHISLTLQVQVRYDFNIGEYSWIINVFPFFQKVFVVKVAKVFSLWPSGDKKLDKKAVTSVMQFLAEMHSSVIKNIRKLLAGKH